MELVDAPQFAPATCCLTSMGGPLIDTGRQVAQFGHAYLHPDVVREAATVLGMVPVERVAALEAQTVEQQRENERLVDDLDAIAEKYNALQGALTELLQHGATVDRKGTIRYRVCKPGDRQHKED